jgi:intein/homing endonuclease
MRKCIAELCGAIIGDGWIQSNQRNLFISGHPTEDLDYYNCRVVQLLEEILGRNVDPKKFKGWGTYGVGIYRFEEINRFVNLGIPIGKKGTDVEVPQKISDSNKEAKKAFLRGLFDTDGTIYFMKQNGKYSRPRLRIASISKRLIEEVKKMSEDLGIEYSNPSPNKEGKGKPNKVYIFEINKKASIEKWFLDIKPENPKHFTKFKLWKKLGYLPPRTTLKQRKLMLSRLAKLKTTGFEC